MLNWVLLVMKQTDFMKKKGGKNISKRELEEKLIDQTIFVLPSDPSFSLPPNSIPNVKSDLKDIFLFLWNFYFNILSFQWMQQCCRTSWDLEKLIKRRNLCFIKRDGWRKTEECSPARQPYTSLQALENSILNVTETTAVWSLQPQRNNLSFSSASFHYCREIEIEPYHWILLNSFLFSQDVFPLNGADWIWPLNSSKMSVIISEITQHWNQLTLTEIIECHPAAPIIGTSYHTFNKHHPKLPFVFQCGHFSVPRPICRPREKAFL